MSYTPETKQEIRENMGQDVKYFLTFKAVGTGGAWLKVKSCFRCISSKTMIEFACSVMRVIVYHDILWCMYVNSLVVVWSPVSWIILARILRSVFVHIHENEWTSSMMIFLKSCVYIKGMFNPEINQLMFIIHTCSILLSFFYFW